MNRTLHHPIPRSLARRPAFTLVEILISILILALGVLGLGALFPVIIREQRLGTDAASGVSVSNSARVILTNSQWGAALPLTQTGQIHPILSGQARDFDKGTQFLWNVLRNQRFYDSDATRILQRIDLGLGENWQASSPTNFQKFGQGEWYTGLLQATTGAYQLGYPGDVWVGTQRCAGNISIPLAQRLFPASPDLTPQFVWDFALQRVPNFEHTHNPIDDPLRAVVFVRRLDPRIRAVGTAISIRDAIVDPSASVATNDRRLPVGEDAVTGQPTLDGTGNYSGIKTCEMEFFFDPATPALNYRDRLYVPTAWTVGGPPANNILRQMWAQMKQPGQKLVDNLGNIYTVVGTGNEPGVVGAQDFDGVAGSDYLKVDPPIPESITVDRASPAASGIAYDPGSDYTSRAIWQVAFTPQIPVSVTLVELAKGSGQ